MSSSQTDSQETISAERLANGSKRGDGPCWLIFAFLCSPLPLLTVNECDMLSSFKDSPNILCPRLMFDPSPPSPPRVRSKDLSATRPLNKEDITLFFHGQPVAVLFTLSSIQRRFYIFQPHQLFSKISSSNIQQHFHIIFFKGTVSPESCAR